jgi:uncharacterized protein (DUF3820 family)
VENIKPDVQVLVDLVKTKMPYGKYKGTLICDLPLHYLEWLYSKGLPQGKLGMLLGTAYEIKSNGLSDLQYYLKQVISMRK